MQTNFCVVGDRAVCLDISRDRYFQLGGYANQALIKIAAGEALSPDETEEIDRLEEQRILCRVRGADAHAVAPPIASDLQRIGLHRARLADILPTVVHLIRARYRLNTGLANALDHLRRSKAARRHKRSRSGTEASSLCATYYHSELFYPRLNNCLPRSLALAEHLSSQGVEAMLVIGVTLRPFQAHCWVQVGSVVVNDRVETVRNFTAILVI